MITPFQEAVIDTDGTLYLSRETYNGKLTMLPALCPVSGGKCNIRCARFEPLSKAEEQEGEQMATYHVICTCSTKHYICLLTNKLGQW